MTAEATAADPPGASPAEQVGGFSGWWARWRHLVLVVFAVAAATLAGRVLYESSDELLTAADSFTDLRPGWVVAAVAVEVASYWARGGAQAVVLRAATRGVGAVTLGAATLAGDAAAYCLPFGYAASGIVMFRALRRRGVAAAIAGWLFAVATALYVGSIALLTVVAVQIAGDADPVPGLQSISGGLLAVLAAAGGLYALTRRVPVRAHLARLLPPQRHKTVVSPSMFGARRRRSAVASVGIWVSGWWTGWASQLRRVRLSPGALALASALMLISWLTDIAVLAIAFAAFGATPPWVGLLMAYCAGQIAAALPITPGGIGVVEGSLTLALVAFGGAQSITLAAVLLYRLIAYWGCIPVGGLAWLALRGTAPTASEHTDPEPSATTEPETSFPPIIEGGRR